MEKSVPLWKVFGVFAKIGAFTIGGGYAMIPIIEDEMRKRGWIDDEELPDIVVLAQSAPGLLAVNMAIFAGYRIRGLKGSIAATAGAVIPSFFSILVIAIAYSAFQENILVQKFFMGLRPVAVALILTPMVRLAKKGCRSWWAWALMIFTLFTVAFLKLSPIYILLGTIIVATIIIASGEGRRK